MNNYNECEFKFNSDSQNDQWYKLDFNDGNVIKDCAVDNLKECTTDLCVIASKSVNDEVNYYQISYNAFNGDIYLYEVKEDGGFKVAYDEQGNKVNPLNVGRMFSGVTLKEGNEYTISLENNKLKLLTKSNGSFSSEPDVDIIIENTENLAIAENIEKLSEFVSSDEDSDISSDESSNAENSEISVAVDTGDENSENVATFQVQVSEETGNITTVPENVVPTELSDSGSGSGTLMMVLLIVVAVIALICGGGAVYFFMQLKKEKKNTENLTAQLSQQQADNKQTIIRNKSSNTEISKLNEIISGYEKTIEGKNKEIKELTEYKQKIDKEIRPVLLNQEKKIEQSQNDITMLEKQIEDKEYEIFNLNHKIKEQENTIAGLQKKQISAASGNEADKAAPQSRGSANSNAQETAKNISLSPQIADEFSNKYGAVFLNINTLLTGDIILSESSSYKVAPLICINAGNMLMVCLNPYYYRDLPDNNETYDNIMRVKNVFEITGLHNRNGYGLEYIQPAIAEKVSDGYKINKMGKIIVK